METLIRILEVNGFIKTTSGAFVLKLSYGDEMCAYLSGDRVTMEYATDYPPSHVCAEEFSINNLSAIQDFIDKY